MKSNLIVYFLFFNIICCLGQNNIFIKGSVSDTKKNPLFGATIVVTKPNSNLILAYTSTNFKGFYELEIKSSLDSIQIKTSYIGFKPQLKIIATKSTSLSFLLLESDEELKEIVIKSTPISKKGDTINYSVTRFKTDKDRVIADVLKKMPGINVLEDGKILYQGKPILKYYIEGLDLLEGKYNLANNNIPVEEVSKVQILENHQPIRILDSLVFSEYASLNIKLKNKTVFVTPTAIGVGAKPMLHEVSVTPMAFTKSNQFIGNFKSNNTGLDVAKELKVLTFEEFTDQKEQQIINWSQIVPISFPQTKKQSWLDNDVKMASFNFLKKIENDFQVKASSSYVNDVQKLVGRSTTKFIGTKNNIVITENKENRLKISELLSKITIEKNTKKIFFKNSSEFNFNWNSESGSINRNEILQEVFKPSKEFNNTLKWIFPYKKTLIELKSNFYYNDNNTVLKMIPGFFEDLLNNGDPLKALQQNVNHNSLFTDTKLGFTKLIGNVSISPSIGFKYDEQFLKSSIYLNEENVPLQENTFKNNIHFTNSNLYLSSLLQYEKNLFKFNFLLPFQLISMKIRNPNLIKNRYLNKLVFNPKLTISREFGNFWSLSTTSDYETRFGVLNELFNGFIIKDYRNITSYDSPIAVNKKQSYKFRADYRNFLKGIFVTALYSNSTSHSNLLLEYSYNNNGSLNLKAIERNNSSNNQIIGVRSSKFFSKINTTLNVNVSTMMQKRFRIINDSFQTIQNNQNKLETSLDYDYSTWLNINVKNSLLKSISKSISFQNQELLTNSTSTEVNIYPTINNLFKLTYENIVFKNSTNVSNSFLDFSYSYTFPVSKSAIELRYSNILNVKYYNSSFVSEVIETQNEFLMRPSQIIVNYKFRL